VNTTNPIFIKRFGVLGMVGLSALAAAFYGCSSSSGSSSTPGTDGGEGDATTVEDAAASGDTGTTPESDSGTTPPSDSGTTTTPDSSATPDAADGSVAVINQKVVETKLLADTTDAGAAHSDPNLVNPWGLVFNPSGPAWVSDNGPGVLTVYKTNSSGSLLTVTVPPPPNAPTDAGPVTATPSGQIFNATADFLGDKFIVSTEDGTISGWQPATDGGATPLVATLRVDRTSANSVYKGLAIVPSTPQVLLAADFHNNHVDVFDATYHLKTTDAGAPAAGAAGSWSDPTIPAGFAPFNVVSIGTAVYVVYAKQDDPTAAHDDAKGPGFGAVSVFDTTGKLVKSLISTGGVLNSPWALLAVPSGGWGGLPAGALLVGNFGDGMINAFSPTTGTLVGRLVTSAGTPFSIDGLWGLAYGAVNDTDSGQSTQQLYFTAGPNDESNGLFGYLTVQ
jgi:uncharacterized protein (TIGR03118 family)